MKRYQHVTTVTKPYTSRKTAARKPGNKNQGTTRTKTIKRKKVIAKMKNNKEKDFYKKKRANKMRTTSQNN